MQSNDTPASPQQHVGSTAELGLCPHLEPCPFCGEVLAVKWRRFNPSARCTTEDCWGSKMPALQLDIPSHVAAWNTRPNTGVER